MPYYIPTVGNLFQSFLFYLEFVFRIYFSAFLFLFDFLLLTNPKMASQLWSSVFPRGTLLITESTPSPDTTHLFALHLLNLLYILHIAKYYDDDLVLKAEILSWWITVKTGSFAILTGLYYFSIYALHLEESGFAFYIIATQLVALNIIKFLKWITVNPPRPRPRYYALRVERQPWHLNRNIVNRNVAPAA